MQLFLLLNLHEILKIYMDFSGKYDIIPSLPPHSGNRKGVYILSAYSFLLSILAGVASGIIVELIMTILRKWFGRKKK